MDSCHIEAVYGEAVAHEEIDNNIFTRYGNVYVLYALYGVEKDFVLFLVDKK